VWTPRFALLLAAGAVVAGLALRAAGSTGRARSGRWAGPAAPYLLGAGGVIALYGVWQLALDALVVHTAGAVGRGASIARFEGRLGLPSEAAVQRLALHLPGLVRMANLFYNYLDFPALSATLGWLFWRHRDRFAHYLATLVALTAMCAAIQAIPVAPPRLVPGFGFIDTGRLFNQAVYLPGAGDPGVLTTMPSVHVAWAAYVAVVIAAASTSSRRWLAIAHPVVTMVVVVVTGNHFWADGVVALLIVALTLALQAGVAAVVEGRRKSGRIGADTMREQSNRFASREVGNG